jgi:hypothetical protein
LSHLNFGTSGISGLGIGGAEKYCQNGNYKEEFGIHFAFFREFYATCRVI